MLRAQSIEAPGAPCGNPLTLARIVVECHCDSGSACIQPRSGKQLAIPPAGFQPRLTGPVSSYFDARLEGPAARFSFFLRENRFGDRGAFSPPYREARDGWTCSLETVTKHGDARRTCPDV